MKHTPGPWNYEPDYRSENGYGVVYQDVNDGLGSEPFICEVALDNEEANARLIAAAPDLLVMLLSIRNGMVAAKDDGCNYRLKRPARWLEKINEVIDKALI